MRMVIHQCPCVDWGFGFRSNCSQARQKINAVEIITYDFSFLDTPDDNKVQGSRSIQSGLSWHVLPHGP